jgi:hypothetical protein
MPARRPTSQQAKQRAEAVFKAKEKRRLDAPKAVQDYLAQNAAVIERTRLLREQRLAREAAEAKSDAVLKTTG